MYYDDYEFRNGDGFYPMINFGGAYEKQVDIEFELYDGKLTQLSGPYICGYDGNTKQEIIKIMLGFEEVKKMIEEELNKK